MASAATGPTTTPAINALLFPGFESETGTVVSMATGGGVVVVVGVGVDVGPVTTGGFVVGVIAMTQSLTSSLWGRLSGLLTRLCRRTGHCSVVECLQPIIIATNPERRVGIIDRLDDLVSIAYAEAPST